MQAKETKFKDLLEGTKQYIVPLFQRTYTWEKKQLSTLWDDVFELYEDETSRDHFMGSIVTIPGQSKPEGVAKFLLIDGQQRLTSLYIMLSVIRNNFDSFSEKIKALYLFNNFAEKNDYYKLLPTQNDREHFFQILNNEVPCENSEIKILEAYKYFSKKIKNIDTERLLNILLNKLSVVSIILEKEDNPYLIFESLNAKGQRLTEADLIRNYFFMKIHADQQEEIYSSIWKPMQDALGDNLTEFIRHFLLKDGREVKKTEIYSSLKEIVDKKDQDDQIIAYLNELHRFSSFYNKLINPFNESNVLISNHLHRLNQLEITTAYPFLLNIYGLYSDDSITDSEYTRILGIIENFIIRRYICKIPTNTLNKIFPVLFKNIDIDNLIESLMNELKRKQYPANNDFVENLKKAKIYSQSSTESNKKTRLILESLELSYNHKEHPSFDSLSIEHVMPQTLNDDWKRILGDDYSENYDNFLHTIGNLSLTGYNPELSNETFDKKKTYLEKSNLELNKYFKTVNKWDFDEIQIRASKLADQALVVWPSFFGDDDTKQEIIVASNITGRKPEKLSILGDDFFVSTWKEVLIKTLEHLYLLDENKFEELLQKHPARIALDSSNFRVPCAISNKYYIETNLSAKSIQELCLKVIEDFELTEEDWNVVIKN